LKNWIQQLELRTFFQKSIQYLKQREIKLPDQTEKVKFRNISLFQNFYHFLNSFASILRLVSINSAKVGESTKKIAIASEKLKSDSIDIEASMQSFIEKVDNLSKEVLNINSELAEIRYQTGNMLDRNKSILEASNSIETKVTDGVKMMTSGVYLISELVEQNRELTQTIRELWSKYSFLIHQAKDLVKIAERTRMLALNAEIEAAHAGEFGKGFAIVAGEMGRLSMQNSEFARNIQKSIMDMQENAQLTEINVSSSVELAQNAEEEIGKAHKNYIQIDESIKNVLADSREFSEAFSSLELTLRVINDHIEQTNSVIQGTHQMAGVIFQSLKSQKYLVHEMGKDISTSFHVSRTLNSLISQYQIPNFHDIAHKRTLQEQLLQGILNIRGIYVFVLFSDTQGLPDYIFSEKDTIYKEVEHLSITIEPSLLQKEEIVLFKEFLKVWEEYKSLGEKSLGYFREKEIQKAKEIYEKQARPLIGNALGLLLDLLTFD
jgi:methyl-accepting chemotaxis protein